MAVGRGAGRRAEGRALVQPQQVRRGEHGAERRDHHVGAVQPRVEPLERRVRREDRGELAPEAGEARQTERGHRAEAEDPPEARRLREHAAEAGDLERVVALLDAAGDEEEHPGDEAVGDHAEDRRVDAEARERRDAEHHEPHVRDGGERDEALHVGLREAAERAVDDADDGQSADPGRPLARRGREDGDRDAHEAVGAELQQDRREDHRPLGGRLRVGVGEPGVEREHRDLDREADEHAGEDPELRGAGDAGPLLHEVRDGEALGPGLEEQREEADEHQRRAEHGVEEELERRILALLAAPDADEEVHREEHDLEEDEEEDEVLCDERARHAGLEHEEEREERLGIAGARDVVERVDRHEERHDRAEGVQREADAVDAHEVRALDDRDPVGLGDELHRPGGAVVEPREGQHGERRRGRRGGERDRADRALHGARHDEECEDARERQERAGAEHPVRVSDHGHGGLPFVLDGGDQVTVRTRTSAATAAAPKRSAPYWLTRPDCAGCAAAPARCATAPAPLTVPSTRRWSTVP